MASIDKRPDGRYRARWREYPGGPQKTRQFSRKGDADRFLDAIRGDLAYGVYVDPAGGRTLFEDYAEQWRAAQVHRASTSAQLETYLRLHAYPSLGRRPLGAVRRSEIQAWVKKLTGVLAPGSVELVYRWVSTIFKAAVGDRLIAASPCVKVALPKRNDAEVVPLSVSELEALVAAVPDRYRALIVFGAGMGLRQGECFGLTVDRVDFLRRQVRVDRQLLGARAGIPEFGPPKSKAGFRTVPMPEVVNSTLAEHLARYRPGRFGLVFTNSLGDPMRRSPAGEMWRRARVRSGVPEWATFHDLRHFYASLLIGRGCSVKAPPRPPAPPTRRGCNRVLAVGSYGRPAGRRRGIRGGRSVVVSHGDSPVSSCRDGPRRAMVDTQDGRGTGTHGKLLRLAARSWALGGIAGRCWFPDGRTGP